MTPDDPWADIGCVGGTGEEVIPSGQTVARNTIQVTLLVWLIYLIVSRLIRSSREGIIRLWWISGDRFVTFARRTRPIPYWCLMASYAAWIGAIVWFLFQDYSGR